MSNQDEYGFPKVGSSPYILGVHWKAWAIYFVLLLSYKGIKNLEAVKDEVDSAKTRIESYFNKSNGR